MGNWYGKGKRGAVMGIWNAHTSLGNILGSVNTSILLPCVENVAFYGAPPCVTSIYQLFHQAPLVMLFKGVLKYSSHAFKLCRLNYPSSVSRARLDIPTNC